MGQFPGKRRAGTCVAMALTILGLLTWGGSARAQTIQQIQQANENLDSLSATFRWFAIGMWVLGIVGAFVLVGIVALRVYMRNSTTTDPMKLAMSDPWVRANLERLQANRAGTPAEGAVAPQAEPAPTEPADVSVADTGKTA